MNNTEKWWNENGLTFQNERNILVDINYGPGSPNEDNLKLLGEIKGKTVLEIGCGGAQCGIALAKKGAKVTGIDISETQLKFAKDLADKNGVDIQFYQGDVVSLKQIGSDSQDIVFSSWALLYVNDLKTCFKEVQRVLKKGGIFVFSTTHPFWAVFDKEKMAMKRSYLETGAVREQWKKGIFVAYHHKISDIINALIGAELIIEKVIEPDSRKHYEEDFWMETYEEYKKEGLTFLPATIIVKAKK
ncbi:class I SAM-dependent methyltransferase [Nanoarchaeota archaeon]